MSLKYEWFSGPLYPASLPEECSQLYSAHYGIWSESSPRPGQPIRLSPDQLQKWLSSPDSHISLARDDGSLIGYSIAVKTKVPKYGVVSWVTQLVVHSDYRNDNIGKTLLFATWRFSDHFAWGLLTANPYAVRALEKATRRRCSPARIKKNALKLRRVGEQHVHYLESDIEVVVSESESRINTRFLLDHSDLPTMLARVTGPEKPWVLGDLPEGWEWFAFTFQDQEQIGLTKQEIDEMLAASDQVARQAYSRMSLGASHVWAQHTEAEVDFVMEACNLDRGDAVLDLGSGNGRHALELARRGMHILGIDYVPELVERRTKQLRRSKYQTSVLKR